MARRPVGFAGGWRGEEAGAEVGKCSGGWQRESEREKEGESQRVFGGVGGKKRMREIRIYTFVQRSMPSMRLVFNALINV